MSDALLNEFIFDSRDHLGIAGSQLLELEKKSYSLPVLNALMGTLHTIKGTSGFFDLKYIYALLNRAENLLQTVREKEMPTPQKVIELLLQVLDTVEAILDRLENGDDDKVPWIETLTQALGDAEESLEDKGLEIKRAVSGLKAQEMTFQSLDVSSGIVENHGDAAGGQISFIALQNGQLAGEQVAFPAQVEKMFKAGLKGLVVDLRHLDNIHNAELKALVAAGRKCPERTVFVLDKSNQQSLDRVFKVLSLDTFMKFFSEKNQAVDYINNQS